MHASKADLHPMPSRVRRVIAVGIRLVARRRFNIAISEDQAWALAGAGSVRRAIEMYEEDAAQRMPPSSAPLLPGASTRFAVGTATARAQGLVDGSSRALPSVRRTLLEAEEEHAVLASQFEASRSRADQLLVDLINQNHDYKRFFIRFRSLRNSQLARLGSAVPDTDIRDRAVKQLDAAYSRALQQAAAILESVSA